MASKPGNDEFDYTQCQHEDSVLGAALVDPASTAALNAIVRPSDFWRPTEREIYRTVVELHAQYPDIDATGILREMRKRGLADQDHDAAWIGMLASRANVNQALTYDAIELRRLAKLRAIRRIAADAIQPTADPDAIYARLGESREWTTTPQGIGPISVATLLRDHPSLREPVVHGILRRGETANIIAPPKVGKSFLAGNLAWSVATGRPWLSHEVDQGRVLILDNELHPETLASRLTHIADEMQIRLDDRDQVDVISMRGRLTPIDALELTTSIEPGRYSLVVLDALYRTIPQGVSENDNAGMMAIYNHLDKLADHWLAAIVVVHHSSKGAQGDKSLTDMGAGAGAISRAADTHIAIRPHETDGHDVLEAVTRSFRSPEPVSISFDWPIWSATTLAPEVKRIGRQDGAAQAKADAAAKAEILEAIPSLPKAIQQNRLISRLGIGVPKFNRLVGCLIREKQVKRRRKTKGKRELVFYSKAQSDSGSDSGNDSRTT